MRRFWGSVLATVTLVAGGVFIASPAMAADHTFDDVPAPAPIQVDYTTVLRTIPVTGVGTVTDVRITLDFHKVSASCAAPGGGSSWNDEIGFTLVSPQGTSVTLIQPWPNPAATYPDNGTQRDRVLVTLDDAAVSMVGVNGYPESGDFRPAQSLSAFDGENPNGNWTLNVIDAFSGAHLCYYGASLTISDATTATTTTVTATPNPFVVGTSTTLTATVTGAAPTGTVQFYRGAHPLGVPVPVTAGKATVIDYSSTSGSYDVTAVYSGDTNNLSSTSPPYTVTVEPFTTTTALDVAPNPITVGEETTLTATVTGFGPAGDVEFFAGADSLGIVPLTDGVASLPVTDLPVGTHQVTAVYAGDNNNTSSAAAATAFTVNAVPVIAPVPTPPAPTPPTQPVADELATTGSDNLNLIAPLGFLITLAGGALLLFQRTRA